MNVGFISLGCSKNLVDTEMMIGIFKENEFNIVNNPKIADVIVINTCGFIESAKEEAINTILEMAEYKKTGRCKVLIATGCLVERYKEDLEKALPEVDIFLKYSDYAEEKGNSSVVFAKVLKEVYDKIESKKNVKLVDTDLNFMNRVITTGEQYSYIRIAEGCSNRCTYSKEDGTPASRLKEQIHPMTKKSRYNKIMKLQQEISKENEKKNIGRELEILIEGITPDKKYYVGRSYMDVPDIDGVAYVKNTSNEDLIGKYVKAKVVDVKDYDLILVEK